MALFDITPSDLKKLAKEKKVDAITRLSSRELRELLLSKASRGIGKNESPPRDKKTLTFNFSYSVKRHLDGFKIILNGRHYSKNNVNSFSRKERIRYSKAISKAAEDFRSVNLQFFKRLTPFPFARVEYTFFNPKSRDHDNNSETIKHFQDTLTTLGFIVDDDRKHLSHPKEVGEVLAKEYSAEAILLPC